MFNWGKLARYWLPVVVLMVIIFSASADRSSFEHSSRFIEPLVRWLLPGGSEATIRLGVLTVRKTAHFVEYFVLTILAWRALRYSRADAATGWRRSDAIGAVALAFAYAVSDEFHQRFVPSRQGTISDIVIDTAGAVSAIVILWSIGRWRRKW